MEGSVEPTIMPHDYHPNGNHMHEHDYTDLDISTIYTIDCKEELCSLRAHRGQTPFPCGSEVHRPCVGYDRPAVLSFSAPGGRG